jgi:MSHA biogenesis protein MshQ
VANLSNRLNFSAPDVSFAPWSAGLASLGVSLEVDPASAADGPYDLTNFGVDIHDSDGVRLQNLNLDIDGDGLNDHAQIGITSIRAGRVAVGNAHGSELRNLDVPVAVQYFAGSGTGFVTHSIDTCTAIGTTTLADADAGDSLALTDTCIVDDAGASGTHACASGTAGAQYTATPSGGVYVTSLKAPGATKTGGIWVAADVPDWVKYDWSGTGPGNPQGLATFGIYSRESGVIYQREIR